MKRFRKKFYYIFLFFFFLQFSDNMDQPMQLNEQNKKINLLEMPTEILENILIHLKRSEDLLTASHVCKSFACAAGTAFARQQAKDIYLIHDFGDRKRLLLHEIMLNKYGEKIRDLRIFDKDDSLLDLIEQKCCNLQRIYLIDVSKIIIVKNLRKAFLQGIINLNREDFVEFINNNQRLENLRLENIDSLDILDGRLNMLKKLTYDRGTSFVNELPKIRLNSLETLELLLPHAEDFVRSLHAMNCNQIKTLDLHFYYIPDDFDNVINEILPFKTLVSLHLSNCPITKDQMRKLANHLPNLTELRMAIAESEPNVENDILSVLSIFPGLSKLIIRLNDNNFRRFSNDLKTSIYDFHAHFARIGTEINIISGYDTVSTSKDRIFVSEMRSVELHWMLNLNERNVREVMNGVHRWHQLEEIKFINNCAETAMDVSSFMHANFDYTVSLDIKSKGPITVNGNVSEIIFSCVDQHIHECTNCKCTRSIGINVIRLN